MGNGDEGKEQLDQLDELADKVKHVAESVAEEIEQGIETLTKGVTDWVARRNAGMRDEHTGRILGPQPRIVDTGKVTDDGSGTQVPGTDSGSMTMQTGDPRSDSALDPRVLGSPTSDSHYETYYTNDRKVVVDKDQSGKITVTEGSSTRTFPEGSKLEVVPNTSGFGGDSYKITNKSGIVLYETQPDGTTILRDDKGHTTGTTTTDGTTTKYGRDADGNLVDVEVRNTVGQVIEHDYKEKDGSWVQENVKGEKDKLEDVKVTDRDGSYTVVRSDGTHLTRRADGIEELRDHGAEPKSTMADVLIDKIKPPLEPDKEKQFRKDLAEIHRLPADQREKVCAAIDKIIAANTDSTTKLGADQRKELATSLAHQIAHPDSISQGWRNTCGPASVEKTLAMEHPDVYAQTVAQLATEGSLTVTKADGTTKTVHPQTDKDGKLAYKFSISQDRSGASKLFQDAAVNIMLPSVLEYKSFPGDAPELEPRPAGTTPMTDGGERLYAVNSGAVVGARVGFTSEDEVSVLNSLVPDDKYKSVAVTTKEELVAAYKTNGPPLEVGIVVSPGDFSGMRAPGSPAGEHAVVITRVETDASGKTVVYYENPSDADNHSYPDGTGVPIDDFVAAMKAEYDEAKHSRAAVAANAIVHDR
jgi:YD repeat-containing protein